VYTALETTQTASFTGVPAPTEKPNIVPLAVGLTLGLLAIAIVAAILGGLWYRRRRRRATDFDPRSAAPYDVPPETQANRQSGLPGALKRHLRQSGAPIVPTNRRMSELGPPPSYDGPRESGQARTQKYRP